MMKKKVMVAMSGGVDSSVAAVLLKEQGYDVTGVTLKLFDNDDIGLDSNSHTCCSLADVEDARSVCYKLGIRHYVFNFRDLFVDKIVKHFASSYESGTTPNPCIDCNRFIKFDALLNRALALEFDTIATGHYARVEFDDRSERYLLKRPEDSNKDQTYVLYSLTQKQLSETLFPLGGLYKSEVRKIAENNQLVSAKKPDSQDICFVRGNSYADFIEDFTGHKAESGNFINKNGEPLGRHAGITHYTIGQRKGLGISFDNPMFVINKDSANNTVTLGKESELYSKKLTAFDVNLISISDLTEPMRVTAKTRYRQKEQPATLYPIENGNIEVVFDEPQRAITPGQAVVFYDSDIVVGGGTIL
ncbi:MAG: tRNA 2-thiouridine(34) synthase MnmA [Bacillota bacterium]|nr:tRNA 2-thiouridine(34) synthase MnmA [Bacillota bacterium]